MSHNTLGISHADQCPSIGPEDFPLSAAFVCVSRFLRTHLSRFAQALDTEKLYDVRAVFDWQQSTPILSLALPPLENLLRADTESRCDGPSESFRSYGCHVIGTLKREIEAIQERTLSAGVPMFSQAASQLKVNIVDVLCKLEAAIIEAHGHQAPDQAQINGQEYAYSLNRSLDYPTREIILGMFDYGVSETETRCVALRQALADKSPDVQSFAELVCMTDHQINKHYQGGVLG